MTIKRSITILTLIFLTKISLGQTIKEDGRTVPLDPDSKLKVKAVVDSLAGEWVLIKTICFTNGDTIIQGPSSAPLGATSAKPPTTIKFDSVQNFTIDQWCMKCPYLKWAGQYEIEIRKFKFISLFYLNFIDKRDNPKDTKQKSLTAEFSGHFSEYQNGTFKITVENGCEWVYGRKAQH